MPETKAMQLALVDDHRLFRKGLAGLIEVVNSHCSILFEADNGIDLQKKLNPNNLPDIILMDVNMPGMDGFAAVEWLNKHFPAIRVLVVSMIEKEESIVRMLKLGVKGYLSKDVEPDELGQALHAVMNKGFYYTDFITGTLVHSLQNNGGDTDPSETTALIRSMNARERDFLQLACSEFTYSEIAVKMLVSPKTVDGYRNILFEKFRVKSRVGLVLFAIRNGLFKI
jgi:two-component system, NarL family, invasion response regulator UvrY